jgi:hypothetical protein
MTPDKRTARTAGLLYLTVAVTGGFSMLYVPSLIVPGDAATTAGNIAANASLFRLGIVSGLTCQVVFVFLVLALYKLFREVNRTQASVMVALVLAAVPVAFLNMLNQLAALHVVSGAGYLGAFDAAQLNALVMLFLDLHGQGLLILEAFWGLWLLPLGLLVLESRFMPRFLGVLLIIGCVGYAVDFLTRLLLPDYTGIVSPIAGASKFGELAMILWLLIAGVKPQPTAPVAIRPDRKRGDSDPQIIAPLDGER